MVRLSLRSGQGQVAALPPFLPGSFLPAGQPGTFDRNLLYSFTDATGIPGAPPFTGSGWPTTVSSSSWARHLATTMSALGRTLIFMVCVTTIQFVLGLLVALVLNQSSRGSNFFRTLYFMPVILGAVIQGLIWSLFLYPLGGPVANILSSLGTSSEFFGGSPAKLSPGSSSSKSGPTWASR